MRGRGSGRGGGTFWAFAFAFCWVRQCFAAAAFNDFAYDTRAKLGSCDSSLSPHHPLPLPLLQLPVYLVCFLFSLELFDNTLLVIDGIYYCRYCLSSSSCFCCCCCCSSPHLCAVFAVLYRWKECLILAQKNSSISHLPHSHSYTTTPLLYATRIPLLYNLYAPLKFVLQRNCTHSVTYLLILLLQLQLTVLHSSYTRRQSRVQLKQDAPQQIHFRLVSFDRIKRARARCSLFNL